VPRSTRLFSIRFAASAILAVIVSITPVGSPRAAVAAPGTDPIFVVTDSVLLGAAAEIHAAFGSRPVNIHGFGGITPAQAEEIILKYRSDLHETLIIGVGYFYPAGRPAEFDAAIDHLLATVRGLGVKRVLWTTMREVVPGEVNQQSYWEVHGIAPFYPIANQQLKDARTRWPELRIADWAEIAHVPDITWDAVHLSPKGAALMGALLAEEIEGFGRPEDGAVVRVAVPTAGPAGGAATSTTATAIANITVIQSRAPGFATVYPCDQARPTTSNLNFRPGSAVSNLAVTTVSAAGEFCVYLSRASHLVVDLQGTLNGASGTGPGSRRIFDTRPSKPFVPGTERRVALGRDVGAFVNVTLADVTTAGYLAVRGCDDPAPPTSSTNALAGDTIATAVFVTTRSSGEICVTGTAAGHLIIDTMTVLANGATGVAGGPSRLLDTRQNGRKAELDVPLNGTANAIAIMTLTSDGTRSAGFVGIVPCPTRAVQTSNLNPMPGRPLANLALGSIVGGKICLHVDGSTDVIVDHVGWLTPAAAFRPANIRLIDTRA
jgi:hypothetical protein